MSNSARYDRHCELWREHDKQLGRWIVGTILFAIVLQHKVLVPFTEIPRQKVRLEGRLQQVRGDLAATQQEREGLKESERRLAEIKAVIKQAPWAAERDQLRRSFQDLQRCAEIARGMPVETFLARMKDAANPAGDAPGAPLLFPPQAPLPEGGTGFFVGAGPGFLAGAEPDIRQFSPESAASRFRAMPGGLPDVGQFPPGAALPAANLPFGQDLPYAPGIPGANDGPAAEMRAVFVLGLDRDLLKTIETKEQFVALVQEQKRKLAQQLADATVERVAELVDRLVIRPLEDLPGEMPEVAQLRADVEKWEQDHLGQPQWYQTVPGKGETIGFVGVQAAMQTDALMQALEGKQRGLEERTARLAATELASKQDLEKLDAQRTKLETRMQKLLPEWLQELVSADQMLQLYPLALIALLAAVGLRAFVVRSHYVVVRGGHESPEVSTSDPAVSSLWTLVYRGPVATLLTAGAYLSAIGIVWWYFDGGCRLLRDWLASPPDTFWELNRLASPGIRCLGHLMFFITAAAVSTVLIRERAAALQQRAA